MCTHLDPRILEGLLVIDASCPLSYPIVNCVIEHFQHKNDVLQGAKVMLHIYLPFQYAESPVVEMESVSECAAVSKHLPQHHLVPHCIHIPGHQSQVRLQPPIIGTTSITLLTMAGSLTL